MAIRIKVGDMVKVLAGDDAQPGSDQGRVSSINHATRTVVVEGMNKVKTSVRRSQKNPQGGKLEKEITQLEKKKEEIQKEFLQDLSGEEINKTSVKLQSVEDEIEEKTLRYFELMEKSES